MSCRDSEDSGMSEITRFSRAMAVAHRDLPTDSWGSVWQFPVDNFLKW
jgi:hypothetical protein